MKIVIAFFWIWSSGHIQHVSTGTSGFDTVGECQAYISAKTNEAPWMFGQAVMMCVPRDRFLRDVTKE